MIVKKRIEAIAKYNPNWSSRGVKIDGEWFNAKGTEADLEHIFSPLKIGEVAEVAVDVAKHELLSVTSGVIDPEKLRETLTKEAKLQSFKEQQPVVTTDMKLDIIIEVLRDIRVIMERYLKLQMETGGYGR